MKAFAGCYKEGESIFYYITVMNEPYVMPHMPGDVKDGILKGMYNTSRRRTRKPSCAAQLLGSGAILNEVLQAQEILEKNYGVAADVWSVTSYKCLYTDAIETERWNRLHPDETPKVPYVKQCLSEEQGVFVAASDYLKTLPAMISKWLPRRMAVLGTDGFGPAAKGRTSLREFFEVDSRLWCWLRCMNSLRTGWWARLRCRTRSRIWGLIRKAKPGDFVTVRK